MKILFMGTPEFALPSLLRLRGDGHEVVAVLTQPDRPAGRGRALVSPPAKRWAERLGLPVFQPERLKDEALLASLRALGLDLGVTVAYGKILPPELLRLPPRGCINVHASLLPKYRGAAPIQRAIMEMDEGMDTGPVLLQIRHPIFASDDAGTLHDRLSLLGAHALSVALEGLREGRLRPVAQQDEEATYAPPLRKEEGLILWEHPARELGHLIRALSPQPGAYTFWRGSRLKIRRAKVAEGDRSDRPPGSVLALEGAGIRVATGAGSGSLILLEVQPEGRRSMAGGEFARGQRMSPGDQFRGAGHER
jgi:methionyl-tRNA formyltransferase